MLSATLPLSSAGLKSPLASASTSSVTYADLTSFVWSAPLDRGASDTSKTYNGQSASLLPNATVPNLFDLKSSASPSFVAKRPVSHSSGSESSVSPSHVTERVRAVFNSSNAVLSASSAVPVIAPEPRQLKYAGLGHGFPSHLRDSGSYTHLPSIPEDRPLDIYHTPRKPAQHAGIGRGFPSALRRTDTIQPSPPSQSVSAHTPFIKRLQTTVQALFSTRRAAKRPVFSIPEFRSREAAAAQSAQAQSAQDKGRRNAVTGQQQHTSMSPMMLLAAQSILEEDRKYRKKEGPNNGRGAQMARLAAQVNCQTQTQVGSA